MRKGIDYFVEFLCWMALLHSFFIASLALVSLLIYSPIVALNDPKTSQQLHNVIETNLPWLPEAWVVGVLSVIFIMSFLIGTYFLSRIVVLHRERRRIVHSATRGHIMISLAAVRNFIERLLMHEFDLRKYRVFLHQASKGIDVRIRAAIPVGRNVLQTGELMQKRIQERVEDRLGVKVSHIEIIAQAVISEGEAMEEEDEEGNRLYTAGREHD